MANKEIRINHAVGNITIGGVAYEFDNMVNISYTNPVTNNIVSSPQGRTDGIGYRTNLTQQSTITVTLREVDEDLQQQLKQSFENEDRVSFDAIDSQNGKQLYAKASLISTDPDNGTIGETETDFDVTLTMAFAWNNGGYKYKAISQ